MHRHAHKRAHPWLLVSVWQCFCGDASSDYKKHGMSTKCNFACPGDPAAQTCGGNLAMSVYELPSVRITDLGCYKDSPSDGIMALVLTDFRMTTEVRILFRAKIRAGIGCYQNE